MNKDELATSVFGDFVLSTLKTIDVISDERIRFQYNWLPESDFIKLLDTDRAQGMKVYWSEMIFRAHIASITSILRHKKWIDGILQSVESKNYFSFAACFRGFIESAADAWHALGQVPITLVRMFPKLQEAVHGKLSDKMYLSPELEDMLIHYSYARKLAPGEDSPSSHKAKTTREYLSLIEEAGEGVLSDCYSYLCEITHPAMYSVFFFLDFNDSSRFWYRKSPDEFNINGFLATYRILMPNLFQLSVNPSLLILYLVNRLDMESLQVPLVDRINFDGVPLWQKMRGAMGL